MKRIILIISCLFAFSPAAFAQLYPNDMYVKGQLGTAETSGADASMLFNATFGYAFIDNLAIEVAYVDFGSLDFGQTSTANSSPPPSSIIQEESVSGSGFNLSMLAMVPMGEYVSLYGRYGFLFWDAEKEYKSNVAADTKKKDDSHSLNYGLGVVVQLDERLSMSFSREQFKMIGHDFKTLQVGFQWRL